MAFSHTRSPGASAARAAAHPAPSPVFEVGLFWDLQQACHVQGQEYDAVFLFYVLVV